MKSVNILASLLIVLGLTSTSFAALSPCAKKAEKIFNTYLKIVEIDNELIQTGFVKSAKINVSNPESFVNTTQGSYDQEFEGEFKLDYAKAGYAFYESQIVHVTFVSSFSCDELKVRKFEVKNSTLTEYGKANGLL
jgi:hypothetical protein